MFQILRRIGFFRRRWVWALLLLAGLGGVGYWMVPWRGVGPELELYAMRQDGTFAQSIRLAAAPGAARAAAGRAGAGREDVVAPAVQRRGVPLVLAVANAGMRPGRPERLVLSMPRWYRLVNPGPNVRGEVLPDEPLQRYVIEADFPEMHSGRVPTLLPGLDTLWIEPWVPDYWCTADADSVPQLVPSTPPDTIGNVPLQVFWSFEGADLEQRSTGLLTVQLPASMFRRSAASETARSDVHVELPQAPRPPMGELIEGGTRYAECGPPGDPMRIFSALWVTAGGGRMISVHYGGLPRKEYYDLDRDSIIELEMWDPDGDGEMEAWRSLRLPIPDYLLPQDPITVADSIRRDSLRADSLRLDSLRREALRADSLARLPSRAADGDIDAGMRPDLETLSRMLLPGDPAGARRLFAPRPVRPRVQAPGPLGTPLGQEPQAPVRREPVPEPQRPPAQEAPPAAPPRAQEAPPAAPPRAQPERPRAEPPAAEEEEDDVPQDLLDVLEEVRGGDDEEEP